MQGPWAVGEVLKVNPKARIGTFALPVSDNPADLRCRVNLDLAIWLPRGGPHQGAATKFLSFLMQPEVVNRYNLENLAFSPLKNAPSVAADSPIAGLDPLVKAGKFYQGPATYLPNVIPVGNYVQAMVLNNDPHSILASLDNDWHRIAKRTSA